MFDPIEKFHIDFRAACIADDENPGYEGRLIDIITEEHIKAAIREYFVEEPEWSEDLMPQALKLYRETEAMEQRIKGFCDNLMSTLLPTYGMRTTLLK